MNAGWIGLGAMGWPMAGHLHRNGHLSEVWNRSADKGRAFCEQHADVRLADDPAVLASRVDVIFLCVSADDDLRELVGIMRPELKAGQVLVDHSTVSPTTARELAAELKPAGIALIDAPVTGGVEGAVKGSLAILAGGDWDAFQQVRPLLKSHARVMHHLGASGSGQAGKAVNQLMVAGIAEAVCESLALMERLDLAVEPMLELLSGGAAANWFLDKRGRSMLESRFDVGFDPKLLLKDLRICRQLCEEAGFNSAVVEQAISDYAALIESGDTGRDISALIRLKRD